MKRIASGDIIELNEGSIVTQYMVSEKNYFQGIQVLYKLESKDVIANIDVTIYKNNQEIYRNEVDVKSNGFINIVLDKKVKCDNKDVF